jgi:hypothetical protein
MLECKRRPGIYNLIEWTNANRLIINIDKPKKWSFIDRISDMISFQVYCATYNEFTCSNFLGVYSTPTLSTALHVNNLLTIANQRLYLLLLLKRQGLSPSALDIIFQAIIVSRFSYALPAFSGYLSAADVARFNAFFRKARRWGVVSTLDLDSDSY